MDIATASPREIDTRLAALASEHATLSAGLAAAIDRVHSLLGERARYVGRNRKDWPTTTPQALEALDHKLADQDGFASAPWDRRPAEDVHRRIQELRAAAREIDAEADTLGAEFDRRPWSRFFWVQNNNGHVHSSRSCSTCYPTTQFGWTPQLSGKTEADAVAELGPLLCTVCFPSAPVEWTIGKPPPPRCEGSGKAPMPGTVRRRYPTNQGNCPTCRTRQSLTTSATIRAHKPPKNPATTS